MRSRNDVPTDLIRLARSRGGVILRSELLDAGLTPRIVARLARSWPHLAPGVYLIDRREPEWRSHVWAAVLIGGPDARAGGLTAAALHGLWEKRELPVSVLTEGDRHPAPTQWSVFHRDCGGFRAAPVGSPARSSVEDTILDAASLVTPDELIAMTCRAIQERRTTGKRLLAAMALRRRLANRGLLAGISTDAATGTHSVLEATYLRDVERAHALPPMVRQYRVPETGKDADGAYPDARLLVELDGRRWHQGEQDNERDLVHTGHRYVTIRVGWALAAAGPCRTALLVARAIGLDGVPQQCPRCPSID